MAMRPYPVYRMRPHSGRETDDLRFQILKGFRQSKDRECALASIADTCGFRLFDPLALAGWRGRGRRETDGDDLNDSMNQ